MINQRYGKPRVRMECLMDPENYDFLCRLALRRDTSMAKLLNDLLAACRKREAQQSSVRSCTVPMDRERVGHNA